MFRNIADDIVLALIRRKRLGAEDRDVYTYAMEVLLLNGSLLVITFFISLFLESLTYYLYFLLFFVPLRLFSGGLHLKKSEACFIVSTVLYTVSLALTRETLYISDNEIIWMITIVCIVMMFISHPLENKHHPIREERIKSNHRKVRLLLVFDILVLCLFHICDIGNTYYIKVFIMADSALFFLGKCMGDK